MRPRRLAGFTLVLLAVIPSAPGLAGPLQEAPVTRSGPRVTRDAVLSGRATREEAAELLASSVRMAGGATVSSSETEPLGGWASPVLAIDLDGDADEETLVFQYSGDYPGTRNVVAVDDGEILWREVQPEHLDLIGLLPANLVPEGGTEAVLVALEWRPGGGPLRAHLQGFSVEGAIWSYSEPISWFELNGVVDADNDAGDEIAITVWQPLAPVSIRVFDGSGTVLREVRSSLEESTSRSLFSEAFVTDGPMGAPDEAVFVTPLLAGYYAERRSLADDSQTAVDLKLNADVWTLYQGPDYTGDGRRDAHISDYSGVPFEDSIIFGVFDGVALGTTWTDSSTTEGWAFTTSIGDATGDGGEDLCLQEDNWDFESSLETSSSAIRCLAGATGQKLWAESRTVSGEYAYTSFLTWSDLDGDDVIDPVLIAVVYTCPTDDGPCEATSFESVAFRGVDGSAIWSSHDPEIQDAVWGLTDADLDSSPGDDSVPYTYDESEPPDAPFSVHSGRTLAPSWSAVIDTGELPGSIGGLLDPDLDGDGSAEAVVSASAYEGIGELICETDEWGEYCYYEDYNEYAYLTAYRDRGRLLWQLEL